MATEDEPRNLPEDFPRKDEPTPPAPAYGQPGQASGQPGHPPYAPTPYGYGPTGQPQWPGQWPTQPPKHPKATTAMVLGIVGLAGSPFSCGLSLLVSPIAWSMGGRAVKEVRSSPSQWSGEGDANTGRLTGLIGTVLLALAVLLVIGFIALVFISADTTTSFDNSFEPDTVPGSSTRM